MKTTKENRQKLILVIEALAFVLLMLPFFYTILYSIPTADDFDVANLVASFNTNSRILQGIKGANFFYRSWSGNWFIVFLQMSLNPMGLYEKNTILYGIFMIVIALAFGLSVYWFFYSAFKYAFKTPKPEIFFGLFATAMVVITNIATYPEIFNWYVGAEYLFELIMAMICAGMTIKFFNTDYSLKKNIILCIVGFVACMTFQMAVIPGALCLLFIILEWIKDRKFPGIKALPFAFMLIGGIVSAFAPGNFGRAGSTELNLRLAVSGSGRDALMIVGKLIREPLIVILMLLCALVGVAICRKISSKVYMAPLTLLYTLFVLFVLSFPRILGYGSRILPNRQMFILFFVGTLGLMTVGLYMGAWWGRAMSPVLNKERCIAVVILFGILLYCSMLGGRFMLLSCVRACTESKYIKDVNYTWNTAYDSIKNATDADVVISMPSGYGSYDMLKVTALSENSEDWMNGAVAEYYGKNSVRVEFGE